MRLAIRVTPKGGRDAIEGWVRGPDGRAVLKVRVSAAPADGLANAAAIALLAKALKRPKSQISIASGAASRIKMVDLEDVSLEDLAAAFGDRP